MDGLLIRINYDFLRTLEKNGLIANNLRFKGKQKSSTSSGTSTYYNINDLAEYKSIFYQILYDKEFLCYSGDFLLLENMSITSSTLKFNHKFIYRNLTGNIIIKKEIDYHNLKNEFFISEYDRYLIIINKFITDYIDSLNKSMQIRLSYYVDPCYVDANYTFPDGVILKN